MDRFDLLRKYIDKEKKGIEIAPWHSPIVPKRDGWNSRSLDLFDEKTLREIALADENVPNENVSNIEPVDFIGSAVDISDIVSSVSGEEKFEYVISSHNFEHLPNPIKFLQGVARILDERGVLSMAIPDRRGTFDYFRFASETADLLEAFHDQQVSPTSRQIFSHYSKYARYESYIAFGQRVDRASIFSAADLSEAYEKAFNDKASSADKASVHCFVYTPSSFSVIVEELQKLGLISLAIKDLYVTDGIEFFVHMVKATKRDSGSSKDFVAHRNNLMHASVQEAGEAACSSTVDDPRTSTVGEQKPTEICAAPAGEFGGRAKIIVCSLEDPTWACPRIRILYPLGRLSGYTVEWRGFDRERGCFIGKDECLDQNSIILIHRLACSLPAEAFGNVFSSNNLKIIDIDDDFFNITHQNPHFSEISKAKENMVSLLNKVEAVLVSTPSLAKSVSEVAHPKSIYVIRNHVNEDVFYRPINFERAINRKTRIIISGTLTHSGDYAVIVPALQDILQNYKNEVELIVMGEPPKELLAYQNVRKIGFVADYEDYARLMLLQKADIALVPLIDDDFNRSKSDIKWLEYSAGGIVGVFSDVAAYSSVEHGNTGIKVSNSADSWYSALSSLIENRDVQLEIAQLAQQEVLAHRSLAAGAREYEKILQYLSLSQKAESYKPAQTSSELAYNSPVGPALWHPESRGLAAERDWIKEGLVSNEHLLCAPITVLLSHNGTVDDGVNLTRRSIELQLPASRFALVDTRVQGVCAGVNNVIQTLSTDWLALIDAGDQLSPDATFRIQQAIEQHPEWQLLYTDEDSLTADGQYVNPHCKPDCNIDYLRSLPYVGGLLVIKKDLFIALGGFDPAADGAEDYDLVLRAWEQVGDAGIGHIPEVLYHRLQGGGHCTKSIEEILAASKGALERHLQRLGIAAEVQSGPFPPSTRVRYPLTATPVVSIIVPTCNQLGMLQRCVESIIEKTRYPNYEILIVDNGSDDPEAVKYLELLAAQEESLGGRLRVLHHPGPFNFSAMNNRAVATAKGEFLLLLNNDTAALHDDWLDEMMSHALRPEVGIVGAKLLFPDGKIQHAGVILGMKGPAEHPFIGQPPEYRGYFGRAMLTQNLSAVTGACLLIAKSLYNDVGGLDEKDFQVSYNDIDLCLKVRELGKKVVFTPWAMLLHEGSASQRGEVEQKPNPEKEKRFAGEKMAFYRKWMPQLAFDPAYNRQLSLASTDFLIESEAALTWDPAWRPRPRILVHPADREGCGEYRIISPMRALQQAGRVQGWETMRIFEPAEMARMAPDSIILQRQMEWPQIEALERHKALSKAFRVFEIDDLITNLPVKSLHKAHIHKDIAKRFRKAAGLCNRLVVATEPLAQTYKGFSDEVWVQPNCIEDAIWGKLQPMRRGAAKPRVGWAGGVGHTGDLEMIADVVRDLAGEVDWIFFGLCPDALRPYVAEFHGGVPLPQYPAKLASLDLDLALAPLEENPFNEAKSHLRLLEYGILGYPVVCSDIFPYQGDFPVWRVANRYRDWTRTIREAVADRAALANAGDRLREHVRQHWLLEEHLDDWLKVWLP